MKRLYDFIYCQNEILTADVIFYLVRVGISRKDKQALRYVKKVTNGFSYISLHDHESQRFIERCAASLFPNRDEKTAVTLIRRKMVEVTWLAHFLRSAPGALLNSLRIPCEKPLL